MPATFGRSDDLAWSPDAAWLAYSFATEHAPRRHQAARDRGAAKRAGDAAGISRLLAVVRPRRQVPLFPVPAHLRPGLRQRPVRAQLPARSAALPDRAAGRRPATVRARAEGAGCRHAARGCGAQAGHAGAAAHRPRRHRGAHRCLPGQRRPLRAHRRRRRQEGGVERAEHRRRTWARRPQGGGGQARGLRLRDLAHRDPGREGRGLRAGGDGATLVFRDGKRLRAIAAEKKPGPKSEAAEAKGRPRARTAGSISSACASRSSRAANGGRCCATSGACNATSSVGRHVGRRLGGGVPPLRAARRALATRADLSDLVWEMQGELGTSHAYEMGGDHRKPPAVALGYLACDTRFDAGDDSYEITRIVRGDPWDASADSPLNAIGVEARVGDRIVAIGGQRLSRDTPPAALLVHQAGAKVRRRSGAAGSDAHAARSDGDDARRRSARTLPRLGRGQSSLGARALAGPRRLLPSARHDGRRLRRVPSLLRRRVRARSARRRRALQPRRPRLAAAAREDRAQAHRLCLLALDPAGQLSRRSRRAGRW